MSINKEPSLNRKPSETQKEKQRKFEEIMKGGSQVQKELDGLNNRFDNGLGKGVSFYKAQLKKQRRQNGRNVKFQIAEEPGTSMPDLDDSPTNSDKYNNLSPKKELDKRYKMVS
jgi:hypothetical protein